MFADWLVRVELFRIYFVAYYNRTCFSGFRFTDYIPSEYCFKTVTLAVSLFTIKNNFNNLFDQFEINNKEIRRTNYAKL